MWTTVSQLLTLTVVDQVLGKMISPTRTALVAVVNIKYIDLNIAD